MSTREAFGNVSFPVPLTFSLAKCELARGGFLFSPNRCCLDLVDDFFQRIPNVAGLLCQTKVNNFDFDLCFVLLFLFRGKCFAFFSFVLPTQLAKRLPWASDTIA
jgi:hypothetical protein